MAIITTGQTFNSSDTVTSTKLQNIASAATFDDPVDETSLEVITSGTNVGKLQVKDEGVTFAKMQHVPANTVLVNQTNSEGDISAKAVADTQILIGDGTGFTAAALGGDVTMTNAGVVDISNDVALGGNPTATTQSAGDNSTRIATTEYADNANEITKLLVLPSGPEGISEGTQAGGIQIPPGYKITSAVAYGYRITVTLYERNVNSTSSTQLATGSTAAKTYESLGSISLSFTDVSSTSTNYIYYTVVNYNGFTDEFHGMVVSIEKI